MRLNVSLVFALVAAALLAVPGAPAASKATYYVSLGDSLAQGFQPIGGPRSPESPPGYNRTYDHGSQLAEAVAFLEEHSGEVAFVTIDLGANDVLSGGGVADIAANLPPALAALTAAAGPGVPIIGMNYYDPFLAPVWFQTQSLAALQAEVATTVGFNNFLEGIYGAFGLEVADVEAAFSVTDLTLVGGTPVNVLRTCAWTWMCSVEDIHANTDGYGVMAGAFLAELDD
jgi:lysophospholipase L1-like esterase